MPTTHKLYLPLLPSHKASSPFGWYSLRLATKGWPGWVDLGGWLHTEINAPRRELNTGTVVNRRARARRRLTSLIATNALPLRQTDNKSTDLCRRNHLQKSRPLNLCHLASLPPLRKKDLTTVTSYRSGTCSCSWRQNDSSSAVFLSTLPHTCRNTSRQRNPADEDV